MNFNKQYITIILSILCLSHSFKMCGNDRTVPYAAFSAGVVSAGIYIYGMHKYGIYCGTKARANLNEFLRKKNLDNLNIPVVFADLTRYNRFSHTQGKLAGLATNEKIYLDASLLSYQDLPIRNKRVILHEFGHIEHKDVQESFIWERIMNEGDYFKSETLEAYQELSVDKRNFLENINRFHEFHADLYAFNKFSNAELYDFIAYIKTLSTDHDSIIHLTMQQNGRLAQEILAERETGVKVPSKVAAEFFQRDKSTGSLANELPTYLSGILLG